MLKPMRVQTFCPKLTIEFIVMIFVLFTFLFTNSTFAISKVHATINSNYKYPVTTILDSMTNNSALNRSSMFVGSPLSITKELRNTNESISIPGNEGQATDKNDYVFSENKSEISTPGNNSHTGEFGKKVKIALVMPTFTAAAYDKSFYLFYNKYINVTTGVNVTTDLNLLSSKVTKEPSSSASGFAMLYLLGNLKWISPESHIGFLGDQDIDRGSIFRSNGSNIYDVIILGHQEYVSQKEYENLKQFVSNGGTMIILDGNVFYAEVKYDSNKDTITLVKGHSWAFNGRSAWRSVNERWQNETAQWVGSNYISGIAKFSNNPFDYLPHEEQYITNPKDIILLNYNATNTGLHSNKIGSAVVATYELNYQKGRVIALGLYSDDIIINGTFDRYFDNLILQYALHSKD
jgi:hypothetical protein